jgi:hypothetical protein
MAWLQATPEKEKQSRMEIFKSRDENHPLLNLPPLESHSYIIEWLFDVGPGMSFGLGLCPLTYQEINAWAVGISINPWERTMLKNLSSEYVSWSNKATKKDCPIPYAETEAPTEAKEKAISNSLADSFRSMMAAKR